ncbi:MAG: Uma2 family endonuclease [Chloroflexi bacterium]|nr:Uma2 family endonuclease [Chloroflexota bacterium]
MALTQRRGLALEEFLKLPEEEPALEFEEGLVSQKVSPKGKHGRLQLELGQRLEHAGHRGKVALAFTELRVTFGGRSYVPSVSVYRRERIPVDEAGEVANDFFEAPDIAVEIVSPEQSVNAQVRRCRWFVANGVRAALLVDPADHSVLLFRAGQPPQPLHDADVIEFGDLLPGFRLGVGELFDSLKLAPSRGSTASAP